MARIMFARATQSDDADIRRLLRENPLGGRYSLSLEREPSAFAAPFAHEFVLARDGATGEAIGLCERTVWPAFVDGRIERLPYLGALRVAASHRHRIAILRGGYATLRREFGDAGDYPIALTSITIDNSPAVRILTAGLRGIPVYRPLAAFSTVAMRPVTRARIAGINRGTASDLPEIAAFLLAQNRRHQFATAWDVATLRSLERYGLRPDDFLLFRQRGRIVGCLALWDVGGHRQSVLRGYPGALAAVRPLANAAAALFGWPGLPPVGAPIRQVMLSHLAVEHDAPDIFTALLEAALDAAARRGYRAAILGLAAARNLAEIVRPRRRAIEYRTMLYAVHWPDQEFPAIDRDGTLPHPDIGLL